MPEMNQEALAALLCPRLRYVQAHAEQIIRNIALGSAEVQKQAAAEGAAFLHILRQVILPLACMAGELKEVLDAYSRIARDLDEWLPPHDREEARFPQPPDRSALILDKLDDLQRTIIERFETIVERTKPRRKSLPRRVCCHCGQPVNRNEVLCFDCFQTAAEEQEVA